MAQYAAHKDWLVAGMSGTGIDGCIAQPTKRDTYRGKTRHGDLYGRVYPSTDAAFAAMRDHGYSCQMAGGAGHDHRAWRKQHDAEFDILYVRLPNGGEFTLPRSSVQSFLEHAENMPAGAMFIPAGKRMPILVTI
jgi:hypothetical protein